MCGESVSGESVRGESASGESVSGEMLCFFLRPGGHPAASRPRYITQLLKESIPLPPANPNAPSPPQNLMREGL